MNGRVLLSLTGGRSPTSGPIADTMSFPRALFKFELSQCRKNERQMRSDSLASKLRQGNFLFERTLECDLVKVSANCPKM